VSRSASPSGSAIIVFFSLSNSVWQHEGILQAMRDQDGTGVIDIALLHDQRDDVG